MDKNILNNLGNETLHVNPHTKNLIVHFHSEWSVKSYIVHVTKTAFFRLGKIAGVQFMGLIKQLLPSCYEIITLRTFKPVAKNSFLFVTGTVGHAKVHTRCLKGQF